MKRISLLSSFLFIGSLFAGCGAGDEDPLSMADNNTGGPAEIGPAHVLALSSYEASVGSLIEVYGTNFPSVAQGAIFLALKGSFDAHDGTSEAVDLEYPVRNVDSGTIRWTDFGPYRNPFSASGAKTGTFHGSIAARIVTPEGKVLLDPKPINVSFKVLPSIVVTEFQPITASCNGAIKRALGGAAYRLAVQAVGFTPLSFTYSMAAPALSSHPVIVRHLAKGPFDSVGEDGHFIMPQVPDHIQSYGAVITIQAVDESRKTYQNSFVVNVHRPIEIYYNGNVQIAEVMAPVPVSACLPGGEAGRNVVYAESLQETRTRSYNVNWNEQWLNSHTVSAGSQQTIGLSQTNGVGFSTTDGESFNWSLGAETSGKFKLGPLVELGVSVNASIGGTRSHSESASASRAQGVNASSTTTETESASQTQGGSSGGGFSWEASSTETISRTFGGQVIARTYGVFYRQTLRLLRRTAVVAYNQCGSANVIAELDFSDWTWAPDLALGEGCPPFPQSNLPAAQCLIPPCSGK
jgi:hypothetical protein